MAAPLASELDEVLFRLGQLQAEIWVDQGEDKLGYYGIRDTAHHLALVVEIRGRRQTLGLDFGPPAPSQRPWAAVVLEPPQPLIFEFPLAVYQLYRDFLRAVRSAP